MRAEFCHVNFNVLDLERSLAFYEEALGLHEVRRREGRDFILVYMGDGTLCRSEERRVGKECRSRWSPYH